MPQGGGAARRIWCEFALIDNVVTEAVTISFADGSIAVVEVGMVAPDDAEVLLGLTLPGFANAHSHAFHRALRGRTQSGQGDFWAWREQMYRVAARLTPENYLDLARATFAEMVAAGYTCVGEFHYVHHRVNGDPYPEANAMGAAIIRAASEAGIRLTLLDACYLRAGASTAVAPEQRRFSDGSVEAWVERVNRLDRLSATDVARIGAAVHSVRALDASSIGVVAEFAAQRSMVLHAHVSEQAAENEQALAEYGCTPTDVLTDAGALSPRFTAVHATHLGVDDIVLYALAGATCCFCPTTERDLADGIGPSSALRAAGVALSIGSDQHSVIDPFEELRGIEMDERLRSMKRGNHAATDLLTMGSANGYHSLGWDNGGIIAVGALADLVTVGLESVRLAGLTVGSLLDAVVFSATSEDVSNVIIAGRTVVSAGVHTTLDVASELRRAIAAVDAQTS